MNRAVAWTTILVAVLFVGSLTASAQRGGNCPPGTCAQNGGMLAKDVSYCSKANCKGKPIAYNKQNHCLAWRKICIDTGGQAGVCASRYTACLSHPKGCFHFNSPGPRCM